MYQRTAAGSEAGATVAFAGAVRHAKKVLAAVYRGVDPVHPIEGASTAASATPTATSITVSGVTASTGGDDLVFVGGAANDLFTGAWTARPG